MSYGMLYVCSKRSEIGIAHDRYANPDCVLDVGITEMVTLTRENRIKFPIHTLRTQK